jgi:hypothetical protein
MCCTAAWRPIPACLPLLACTSGAESPEEIALSILAEIQCVFGAGTAQQLAVAKRRFTSLRSTSSDAQNRRRNPGGRWLDPNGRAETVARV